MQLCQEFVEKLHCLAAVLSAHWVLYGYLCGELGVIRTCFHDSNYSAGIRRLIELLKELNFDVNVLDEDYRFIIVLLGHGQTLRVLAKHLN